MMKLACIPVLGGDFLMKTKPIYVKTEIATSMDRLWKYTQDPNLHTEWDARFTEITYLEKQENEPQRFLYKTKIGLGLEIAGTGESIGEKIGEKGERVSSLKFETDNPISLISVGRGYWKYKQVGDKVEFMTQYDYEARFGKVGKFVDKMMFRPLLGWATAWSFDALKLWLEKGYHPRQSMVKTLSYWLVCLALAVIWIYQGLVPKLLFVHPEEVEMTAALFGQSLSKTLVPWIGIGEILFGLVWIMPFQKRKLFLFHVGMMFLFAASVGISNIGHFSHPFNPITLNASLIFLSIIGYFNSSNLPSASHCQRKRKG
jgi:uncharacterized membrane protein YphA (DoxX/SURF4 family)